MTGRQLRLVLVISLGVWLLLALLAGGAVVWGWFERSIGGRRELAYVLTEGMNTHVLLLDTRRGTPLELSLLGQSATVAGGSTGSDLYWSPDGQRLAFIQQQTDGDAIVVIDMAARVRTERLIGGLGGRLAWSADGRQLVYSRFNRQRQWDLYAIETTNLAEARLDTPPLTTRGRNSYNGLWSPDGGWLAYQTGDVSEDTRTLFLRDGDQPALPMTRPPFLVIGGLAFSPDSTRLIFTGIAPGRSQQEVVPPVDLYLLDLIGVRENTFPTLLPLTQQEGHASEPVWSPDGRRIAFVLFRESGKILRLINVANLSTGTPAPEAGPLTSMRFADVSSPSWSPDGKQLAFLASTGGGWLRIYTLDLASEELHALTSGIFSERSPVWRPSTDD